MDDEEDCEEGEIKEPGSKPFVKPHCRFFMRGHCTWGINCRFLHPGVNDKGRLTLCCCFPVAKLDEFNTKNGIYIKK